ncbi:APC family permease [Acidipropionibacterium virtanenii]|uniref:Putative amino acid permease YhdG n=1 Tax=Acidipropionibacterium virtanenii TaxID=2057246 RepID=A0A344USR9_9ACTN|nr:amino acid permease [Acidipropionibacterium virtanenii]AXE38317.1 putative amino acid permease YhdG [Acidipropionibacterium virtanenii]
MSLLVKKGLHQVEEDLGDPERSLKRELGAMDIAVMGVAVAVGAGIFSVGAQAAADYAGPSVIISFILAALVCGLAVMNYAEFASSVPVSGSAYTFSYLSLGELLAWVIGWDLILEMLMAASVISKYWGIYLQNVFEFLHVDIATEFHIGGVAVSWPPAVIVAFFTTLLVLGTKLTSRVNGILTAIKITVTLFIIVAGAFYVKASNFTPFFPPSEAVPSGSATGVMGQSLFSFLSGAEPTRYGAYGLLGAAALVFFAFVGFDIVATTAEEAKDPQKTLPRGIFGGLALVSVLYVAVTIVVTGMVSYKEMAKQKDVSLATAFKLVGANWVGTLITIGILIGLTTVVMVLLLGLTRVVFSMCRDGLLPRQASHTSKRGTPARLQILCGIIVAIVAALADVDQLSEMINIGTLSAFVLVSFSIPVQRKRYPDLKRGFTVPFSPVLPIISGVLCLWLMSNLAVETWLRFVVWLLVGFVVYFGYSYLHSRVRIEGHELSVAANFGDEKSGAQVPGDAAAPIRHHWAAVVLTVLAGIVVLAEVVLALIGVIDVKDMSTGLVWLFMLVPVPGIVVSHRALSRADAVEQSWDAVPRDKLPVWARFGAAIRMPLSLLSVGYGLTAVAVVVAIVHMVEVL